jgi:hypothetical protein
MGIIDKRSYKLICKNCDEMESSSIHDKGSNWNGSSWDSQAIFSKFDTSWCGGGKDEPELLSAFCKQCTMPASISSNYNS